MKVSKSSKGTKRKKGENRKEKKETKEEKRKKRNIDILMHQSYPAMAITFLLRALVDGRGVGESHNLRPGDKALVFPGHLTAPLFSTHSNVPLFQS